MVVRHGRDYWRTSGSIPLLIVFITRESSTPVEKMRRNHCFFRSDDFGETWEEKVLGRKLSSVSVNDMISIMIDGMEILYLGTNKGVFSYVP